MSSLGGLYLFELLRLFLRTTYSEGNVRFFYHEDHEEHEDFLKYYLRALRGLRG